ncbi:MAG: VWA domain-containing protein [Oscillospiraceae bacterium]|nr:VWA domain-containing protein [Oscillospiraceae bacterium]
MKMKKTLARSAILFALALAMLCSGCDKLGGSENYYLYDYEDDYYWVDEPSESYLEIDQNREIDTADETTITFSMKVDTAAYTNITRFINDHQLPPADAVRTEELINYFNYDEKLEFEGQPFAIQAEIGPSPLSEEKHMAFIRVKTEEIAREDMPPSNLTFLIDTSGSMNSYDKLPLLQSSLCLLVETLEARDTVSIVTYAGSSEVLLDSVPGNDTRTIMDAINSLSAGGRTAGAKGIVTAYDLAEKNYLDGGNNRVILASDGDFNVGISSLDELKQLIKEKRESGVYLSVLGFGTGNLRDDIMETLAKHGNGNYSYINSLRTAQKVLVDEMGANLFTVADDVKAQVVFNPDTVTSYRLIGYENRKMRNKDFDDDTKDAGEIGTGADVVVMFELRLAEGKLKGNLFDVNIRYKDPGDSESQLITSTADPSDITDSGSSDFNFACSVAAFGELLRGSEYARDVDIDDVLELARDNIGIDRYGYRGDHIKLLKNYRKLIED